MKLRYFILPLVLVCLAAPALASTWTEVYTVPDLSVRSVVIVSGLPYVGTYDSGLIYRIPGVGYDWALANNTGQVAVYGLAYWNSQVYAATGNDGKIFRGTGTSWTEVNDTVAITLRCFGEYSGYFYTGGSGGSGGEVYRTNDGTNWDLLNNTVEGVVYDIQDFGSYVYFATGNNGKIVSYQGTTWAVMEDFAEAQCFALETWNGYMYVACGGAGGGGKIYRTSDGDTYTLVFSSGTNYIYGLNLFNNRLYAVGTGGVIYSTTTGTTWETDFDTTRPYAYCLASDEDIIYAGTGDVGGVVYSLGVADVTTGAGIQYPPHSVNIKILSFFGAPVSDATVTAVPVETTMGEWSWLQNLWGISNEVNVVGDTMTGTTDRNGVVGFVMFEEIQYLVNVTKAADGISWSQYLYPTESDYVFVVTEEDVFTGGVNVNSNLSFSVTTAEINSTYQGITIVGNDSVGDISGITVYLNITNKTVPNKQDTVQTFTAASGNFTHTFPVTDYSGDSYIVNLNLTQGAFGDYERSFGVTFPIEAINPLNLPSDLLLKISIVILCLTGCIFTATTAHNGPILTCFIGWILLSIGFLNAMGTALATTALTAATIFSVFILIAKKKEERP